MSRVSSLFLLFAAMVLAVVLACSERPSVRFPHRLHVAQLACGGPDQHPCMTCNSCHQMQESQPRAPARSDCVSCHRESSDELLAKVHRSPEAPPPPAYQIHFSHEKHLAMSQIRGQCVTCHSGAVRGGDAPDFPPMERCFACHEHAEQWERSECAPCHDRADVEKLVPQTFLHHVGDFIRRHGVLATQERAKCESCHTQADCDDCHDVTQNLTIERRRPEAITQSFVHRGDFITRHPIEAQMQQARCMTCHTSESCDACHVERGISGNRIGALNPHPPGWVGANPQARDFHGRAARREVALCASCHEQGPQTNCIRCHKVGAFGGNPHPSGWKSSQSKDDTMCRYCHGT